MASVTVTKRWHRWDGMRYRVWARPAPESATPPLVLIHGYAACVEQWGRFIRDIGPDVPVYAVDLIGYGESSKPPHAPYGRAFYVAQLEHLRGEYGLERIVPVGHSLGGMLGIEWAAAHPEAAPSVIAVAPGGLLFGDEFSARQIAAIRRVATPFVMRSLFSFVTHLPYRLISASAYADRAAIDPYTETALKRAMRSPGAAWSYSALVRNPEGFHAAAHLVGLGCPLHVIWGSKDAQVSRTNIDTLLRHFPHGTLTVLEGGGHCLQEERSREVAADVRAQLVADGLLHPTPAPLIAAD
jgi:pimeloyl-ACP methyl ester carboxylesterase